MACTGCQDNPEKQKQQHAERFKAWYVGGDTFQGCCEAWNDLPDDGCLAVKVWFNDGTARVCSGNDWYGLHVAPDGFWTLIHNNHEDNKIRYPDVVWKRGMWTSESEMQAVNDALAI